MKVVRVLVIAAMLSIQSARAELSLDRSLVVFPPDSQPRQDIQVTNTGEEAIAFAVEVSALNNPGTPEERRQALVDTRNLTLFATPSRLIVPAGATKPVRLVNLQPSKTLERVYELKVTRTLPVPPAGANSPAVVNSPALIIVRPSQPAVSLQVTRRGQRATLLNNGNVSLYLNEGQQCDSGGSTNCQPLPERRLFAGNTWVLELPFNAPFSFEVQRLGRVERETFP